MNALLLPNLAELPLRFAFEDLSVDPPSQTRDPRQSGPLSNSVCRERLRAAMPYLWEINEKADYPAGVDWCAVYDRLKELSFLKKWNRHRWREHVEGSG